MRVVLTLLFGWLLTAAGSAVAHPLAPALLQLRELAPVSGDGAGDHRYDVLWRTSVTRTQQSDVQPRLPPNCTALDAPKAATEGGDAVVARWTVRCGGSLVGQDIGVDGLATSGINVIVQLQWRDDGSVQTLLGSSQPAWTVPSPVQPPSVGWSYLRLGVEHLLTGLDHVLFVTGLFLLVRGWRPLLLTITAFTVGHSITLALATLHLIHVHQSLAEFGIALSILVLATEVVRPAGTSSLLFRRPWLMAGTFGLLHGLGFAGALADVGLPPSDIPLALLAFNVGIELGQLLLVGVLLLVTMLFRHWRHRSTAMTTWIGKTLPGYGIGTLAAYWCWGRLPF